MNVSFVTRNALSICLALASLAITIGARNAFGGSEDLDVSNSRHANPMLPLDKAVCNIRFQTATFGLGCFWAPDSQFGSLPGVLRTRVGYCGGLKENPTSEEIGDHTEVVQVDLDPTVTSYEALLKRFWENHNCARDARSKQYRNVVFYHDEAQRMIAEKTRTTAAQKCGIQVSQVKTAVMPAGLFTYAAAFHQKFSLGRHPELRKFLTSTYPTEKAFTDSTVASRLNAFLGSGFDADLKRLAKEIEAYGMPKKLRDEVLAAVKPQKSGLGPLRRDRLR